MTAETDRGFGLEFDLARVTIEMTSPFLLGSGEGDRLHDQTFVVDANGLPTIPGESLAGVLRHALCDGADAETERKCREAFGFQEGTEGRASAISISFAQVHDCGDRPVPFRGVSQERLGRDAVLRRLVAGVPRDHVRLGAHGAVDGRGKFDELLVPAGARFTFEIVVDTRSPVSLEELMTVLARSHMRLGANSRRGFGRFRLVRLAARRFDLRKPRDFDLFAKLPVPIEEGDGGVLEQRAVPAASRSRRWIGGTLRLTACDTWLVGGTLPPQRLPKCCDEGQRAWDRFPFVEERIVWSGPENGLQKGQVLDTKAAPFVVPASGIKGALRHRTAYHARRESNVWLDPRRREVPPCPEEIELFGEAKDEDGTGQPGRVLLEDGTVESSTPFAAFQHVSLDRFTQGPRDGLLFNEQAVFGGSFTVRLEILDPDTLSNRAVKALHAALDDLCSGRLAVGAGRAHGHFRGQIEWEDDGAWIGRMRP